MRKRSIVVTQEDRQDAWWMADPDAHPLPANASPVWWAKRRRHWAAKFRRSHRRGSPRALGICDTGEHRAEACLYCRAGATPCPVERWHVSTLPF